jgi:hypothetical protein
MSHEVIRGLDEWLSPARVQKPAYNPASANICPDSCIMNIMLLAATLLMLSPTLLMLFPGVFYILTLRNALLKCSAESRTMDTGNLWLLLTPIFNLGWHFVVVLSMGTSLRNECARWGIRTKDPEPGKLLGLGTCILLVCSFVPAFGPFLALAGLVCWIIYWVKISGYSQVLDEVRHITLAAT